MSHLRVVICRVEENAPDTLTELAHVDLPATDVNALLPSTTLDVLEAATQKAGSQVMQSLLQAQWEEVDVYLTQQTRQAFPPSHP